MKVEKEYLAKNLENIFMKMIYKLKFINCGIRNYSNNNSIIFLGEWRQWLEPGPSRPLMELIFSGTPGIVLVVKNFIHKRGYAFANFLAAIFPPQQPVFHEAILIISI